jgi:uracil phosphoribosyltransferase
MVKTVENPVVQTELAFEEIKSNWLSYEDYTLVPILRAGLGMLESALFIMKEAKTGFIGIKRDEKTLEPDVYCINLPEILKATIILDPMLATGGSVVRACEILREKRAKKIEICSVVCAPEGIKKLEENFPEVNIITAVVDERLNEIGYIVPGLGDCGDRLYG